MDEQSSSISTSGVRNTALTPGSNGVAERVNKHLDHAEADIRQADYAHAALNLARADGEVLAVAADHPQRRALNARACWLQSLIYYYKGETNNAHTELEQAAALLEQQPGSEPLLANVLNNLGNLEYYKENNEAASDYYTRSGELAVRVEAYDVAAKALSNLGILMSNQGTMARAQQLYLQALEQAQLSQQPSAEANAYRLLASFYFLYGPVPTALNYLQQAVECSRLADNQATLLLVNEEAGQIYLNYGDLAQAEAYLSEAYTVARRTDSKLNQLGVVRYLATLSRLQGNWSKCYSYALRAFNDPLGTTLYQAGAALELVYYYLAQQELGNARRYVHWLKVNHREVNYEDTAVYQQAAAMLQTAQEEWEVASYFYQAAIATLSRMHNNLGLAKMQQDYAAMLLCWAAAMPGKGHEQAACAALWEAARLYRQLELPQQVASIEQKLRELEPAG